MYKKLPCLPLVVERHINSVRTKNPDYKYPELDLKMFSQCWGSTALGFGGIGGQAMTSAYTVVVNDYNENISSVFFGDRLAYTIFNPNDNFFNDMAKEKMEPVNRKGKYLREDSNTK